MSTIRNVFLITSNLIATLNKRNQIKMSSAYDQITVLLERLDDADLQAISLQAELKNIRSELEAVRRSVSLTGSVSTKRGIENDELLSCNSKKLKGDFSKAGDYVVVYTDGACENNGRPNAKAGIGVWFGPNHPLNASKPVDGRATNNTAEIQACTEALKIARSQGVNRVKIVTDSQFTINCMTKWLEGWKRKNWKLASGGPVKNKEDLEKLDSICRDLDDVKWEHVAGHQGIEGNEEADKLARQGALRYRP